MKLRYIYQFTWLLAVAALWSCEPKVDEFTPSKGEADFSKFIAIGDSYTAGYTDGALGRKGQEGSFSAILGKQLMYVGSESYNQPWVQSSGSIGGIETNESGEIIASNGYYTLQPVNGKLLPVPGPADLMILKEDAKNDNNQNFGVPGAKVAHLSIPGLATVNPFYGRFASNPLATVINDALAAQPTFASLWIGNNDILGYALEGGEDDPITPSGTFTDKITDIVDQLTSVGAKVVVGNIPAVETIPFFTTVKFNNLVIDEATAQALNSHPNYIAYNEGADALDLPRIEFVADSNALVVIDENYAHPAKIRQLKRGEKVLLSALSGISDKDVGWGYMTALEAKYFLDEAELTKIKNATTEYNNSIADLESSNVAVVDLHKMMIDFSKKVEDTDGNMVYKGVIIDGNKYSSEFVSGGVFSLDGIHATDRGSAVIANAFIDAINDKFGSSVPRANINSFDMVEFP